MVLALIAALLTLVPFSPAAADTGTGVSAQVRLSSGAPTGGYVLIHQQVAGPDGPIDETLGSEQFTGGAVDFDLNPGTYSFSFESWDTGTTVWYSTSVPNSTNVQDATPVVVGDSPVDLGTITFAVRNVNATVKDAGGNPLVNMSVRVDTNLGFELEGRTNAAGVAIIHDVPTTELQVESGWDGTYDFSDPVTVPAGTADGSVNLVRQRKASISGRVTGSGGLGLDMVAVTAYDAASGDWINETTTDSQGNYNVSGLDAGSYHLQFIDKLGEYTDEYWNETPENLSGTAIPVAARQAVGPQDVQLEPTPTVPPSSAPDLTGVVHGAGGKNLGGVRVRAYRNGVLKDSTTTGRDGRYTFNDLTSGSYKLSYSRLSGTAGPADDELPYVDTWYLNSRSSAQATPVSVIADSPGADKSLTLQQYGVITGLITGDGGTSLSGSQVQVYDADGEHVTTSGGDREGYQVQLAPGAYYLRFSGWSWSYNVSYLSEWYRNGTSMLDAQAVTVISGGTVSGIDAVLASRLESKVAPAIVGVPVVGRTLTATTGTWNRMVGNDYRITWLRSGTTVGTGSSYVVKAADVGKTLSVKVDAAHGALTGVAFSASTRSVMRPSATSVKATSTASKTVKLVVAVTGTGLANPGGTVTIKRGSLTVKSKVAVVNGKATITLKAQPGGKRFTYQALYSGTGAVLGSSGKATVTVKR